MNPEDHRVNGLAGGEGNRGRTAAITGGDLS
jgi:hypothetical protein